MTVFDYVVIGLSAIGLIAGLFMGLTKILMSFVGWILVISGTFILFPYPVSWLGGLIEDPILRIIVGIVATALALFILWTIVKKVVSGLVGKVKVIQLVDKLLGAAVLLGCVYGLFALAVAVLNLDNEIIKLFKEGLGENYTNSWVVANIFTPNPIGEWLAAKLGLTG